MGNDPVKIAANKGFQATAHKLPLCDRFPSLQSYIVLPVGRRLNPDVQPPTLPKISGAIETTTAARDTTCKRPCYAPKTADYR